MSYLATCTFDLKGASSQDYQNAYADLAKLGLRKLVVSNGGNQTVVPTTMTVGEFNGQSAAAVRDWVRDAVKREFAARQFSSEIFVVVGDNWAWGAESTAPTASFAR